MNIIYNTIENILNSTDNHEKVNLMKKLNELIVFSLNDKHDLLLAKAIEEAKEKNPALIQDILSLINDALNIIDIVKDGVEYISYLTLIPSILISTEDDLYLPSISTIEYWFKYELLSSGLIDNVNNFNMSPVLLTDISIAKTTPAAWYNLHKVHCEFLEKRALRPMFENPFKIKTVANRPQLQFFLANVMIEKNSDYDINKLYSNNNEVSEELITTLSNLNRTLNENVGNTKWKILGFNHPTNIIHHAYEQFQLVMILNLIKHHIKKFN